jgi:replicative DNA helicase
MQARRPTVSSRNGTGHQNRVADAWPHNQEAEGCVIGSALIDPDSVHEVAAFLRPEHFFRASFGEAWRAILNLYGAGSPIDGVSVGDEMRRMGVFAKSGGDDTLSEAMASTPSAVNMRHYAGIVREKWVAREIKVSAQAILTRATTSWNVPSRPCSRSRRMPSSRTPCMSARPSPPRW